MLKVLVPILIVIVLFGGYWYYKQQSVQPQPAINTPKSTEAPVSLNFDKLTVMLRPQTAFLKDGVYESTESAGTTVSIQNRTFSTSKTRGAAIIVEELPATNLYYLVGGGLYDRKESYSNAQYLEGRVVNIDSIKVHDPVEHDYGQITVNFTVQAPGTPMWQDNQIKVAKKYAFQEDGNLIEILH